MKNVSWERTVMIAALIAVTYLTVIVLTGATGSAKSPLEYKVVHNNKIHNPKHLQRVLDTNATEGWKMVWISDTSKMTKHKYVVFARE